ncbi:hypothetical protein [Tenacibaculum xiamenense]|uniref:hypothetical protein n=1 Tax=Tenacibaculum xiamenense TaxID=1261553 RepID=UPI00389374E7
MQLSQKVASSLTKPLNMLLKNINWTKKSGILIIGICLSAMLLKYLVQPYRGTWIYQYGSLISLFVFSGGVLWSLINTILLISKHKTELKNNLVWIFLSAIPFLYIVIIIMP